MYRLLMIVLLLGVASCGGPLKGCYRYSCESYGNAPPIVAVMPPKDSSWSALPWSLGEELRDAIREGACTRGHVQFVSDKEIDQVVADLHGADLFDQDLDYFSRFEGCDFIVLIDFLEHAEVPYHRGEIQPLYIIDAQNVAVLQMKVHLRVVDLRGSTPALVLHEIMPSNHMIAQSALKIDYTKNRWGTAEYLKTPVGKAHGQLGKDIARRIEEISYSTAPSKSSS